MTARSSRRQRRPLSSLPSLRIAIAVPLVSLLVASCAGELASGADAGVAPPDSGSPDLGAPDASEPDLGMPDMTMEPMIDPLCVNVTCLPSATCYGGICYCDPGFMGDPTVGCMAGNPCTGVDCPFGATCRDDGMCACDTGFEADSLGGCVYVEPGPPEERSPTDVCEKWNQDYPETAVQQWQTLPSDECDAGELDPKYLLDAVRRVSLYRWLAGLPAVTTHPRQSRETQACATALAAENVGVRPTIESSFRCYSSDAAAGAAASNIARGLASPAASVDYFMVDQDVESLGRRRWILNPSMGATSFGFRGDYTCMYATDDSGSGNPLYVAYPHGTFPVVALRGAWTFSSGQLGLTDATVAISASSGGAVPAANVRVVEGNFGLPTLAWDVEGTAANVTYTVTVSGLTGPENEVTYSVALVACP